MLQMYEYVLYDELTLRGVTYGHDFWMMKQKCWFLPKIYNGIFPSNDHYVTCKSWFQDDSGKACFDAKQSVESIHPKGKF